jgi:predicted RNA-binding protein with PUA-like domain
MAKAPKKYWLMKSEPSDYSIDDLKADKTTLWDGVRNHQARNQMMEMKKGDEVLFYHSMSDKAVVGVMRVTSSEAYPDPTQFRKRSKYYDEKSTKKAPRWFLVDVRYVKKLKKPVTLAEIKARATLKDMVLVKNSRLSVQPVRKKEFDMIVRMGTPAAKKRPAGKK